MKKRRNFFALALVAMVLVLGVGYATVSQVGLTIDGTSAVKDSTLNVVFTGTPVTKIVSAKDTDANNGTKVTATSVEDGLTATINVGNLTKVGDTVTATYHIKNKETDIKAKIIENSITNSKSDFFEVTTDVKGEDKAKVIDPEGTTTVTVTVTLKKLPIESADSKSDITINLDAIPVAK